MPGTQTANAGDGGGTARYFRISNKEVLRWNGTNIDATPSGLSVTSIDKPENIDVQEADKQTQSGYITLDYTDRFTLALTQGSRIEAGVDLLRRLIALPSVASGGGSQAVAQALSSTVSSLLSRVRVSLTATATANLYRTVEDGGGTIVVLSKALTKIDGEVDPDDLGGIKFTAKTRLEEGAQGPIPNTQIKDAETHESTNRGTSFEFTIGDSVYLKLLPVGSKAVILSITLEADLAPPVDQGGMNTLIDEIKAQLRQFGLTNGSGNAETLNTPKPQAGQTNEDFLQQVANFGASLLGAFQAILNVILNSVKRRILGALVSQTTWSFEIAEAVPPAVREQLALARAPDGAEKPYADLVVERRSTDLSGGPGATINVIDNTRLRPSPMIDRMLSAISADAILNLNSAENAAIDFTQRMEADLQSYSVEDLRTIAKTFRPLFGISDQLDVGKLGKDELIASFRIMKKSAR